MRIVIDTNIAFSAILNTNGKISRIILHPRSGINLYSSKQLQNEIVEHWSKLKKISKYSEKELHEAVSFITSRIKFINSELIPDKLYKKAEELTRDSDIDDTEFVALTEHIKGKLWTVMHRRTHPGFNFLKLYSSSCVVAVLRYSRWCRCACSPVHTSTIHKD